MNRRPPLSPYLGGPGARWAQVLLLVVHLALEGALVLLALAFGRLRGKFTFAAWQEALLWAGIAGALLAFGWQAFRIARDLWLAIRERRGGLQGDPERDR